MLNLTLDVTFYDSMKNHWQQILLEWKSQLSKNQSTILPKDQFPALLKQLLKKLGEKQKGNLISGFKKCGVFPVSAEAIKSRLLTISAVTNNDELDISNLSDIVLAAVTNMLQLMRCGGLWAIHHKKDKR